MSGSQPTPVEQHLGDRLAALVDGELGHDARERVLAHLATCPKCKAEADAQRRLKSVFAETAPPPPSASLLARLQGLPGGTGDGGDDSNPFRGGGLGAAGLLRMTGDAATRPPLRPKPRTTLDYGPSGPHAPVLPHGERGFRIHDVGRQEAERSASRGRRFAFVAAGAVSLAALALSGLSTGVPASSSNAGGGAPSNVTPLRTAGPAAVADAARRRNGTSVARSADSRATLPQSVTPIAANAPLLPGVPAPHGSTEPRSPEVPVTSSGAAPYAPLIHATPVSSTVPYTSWTTDAGTPSP